MAVTGLVNATIALEGAPVLLVLADLNPVQPSVAHAAAAAAPAPLRPFCPPRRCCQDPFTNSMDGVFIDEALFEVEQLVGSAENGTGNGVAVLAASADAAAAAGAAVGAAVAEATGKPAPAPLSPTKLASESV